MTDDFPFPDRYKPTTLARIVGHRENIQKIEKWLTDYDTAKTFLAENNLLKKTNKGRKKQFEAGTDAEDEYRKSYGSLTMTGPNGCGKTSILNLILKKHKYEPISLNQIEQSVGEIDAKFLFKIDKLSETGKKHILIVDDYDSIISPQSKKAIEFMIKENNFLRLMPIIVVTNDVHNKNATPIEKNSNKIEFFTPHPIEIANWVRQICCYDNGMRFADGIIQKFIDYFERDMRKIVTQLWELYLIYRETTITNELFERFIETMKHSSQNVNLFKSTAKILSEGFDMKFCLEKYEIDKIVLPLMIYQNYPKFIDKEHHHEMIERLSNGDIFEYYIHCEQSWDLMEINGLMSCALLSYYANKFGNGAKNQTLKFAMDLNKTSFKKKNRKRIIEKNNIVNGNSTTYLRNKTIDEFNYMNDIEG